MAYTDFAYYAWARYRVLQSSYAWDHLLQGTLHHRLWTFSARYRLQQKQRDNVSKTALQNLTEHRLRLSAGYAGKSGFSSLSQLDGCYLPQEQHAWGRVLTQRFPHR